VRGYGSDSYGEAFADVYDDWYAGVSPVEATVARLAELAGTGPVLELGVGTGRLALPLAATGLEVLGIDTSGAMLDRLRAKVEARGPGPGRVTGLLGDMASDLPGGPFPLVFAAYNTLFNLRTVAEQERCFRAVAARLAPAGHFVVEAFVPDDPPRSGTSVDVRDLATTRASRPPTVSSSSSPVRVASGSDRGRSAGRRPSSSTPWPQPPASSWRSVGRTGTVVPSPPRATTMSLSTACRRDGPGPL
jgi:SAM-dependent methyltransferase